MLHVLAENIAQATTLLVGLAFKDANGNSVFPLAPVQILWVIMVRKGLAHLGIWESSYFRRQDKKNGTAGNPDEETTSDSEEINRSMQDSEEEKNIRPKAG